MSSFNIKNSRNRRTTRDYIVRVGFVIVGIIIVWIIARAVIGKKASVIPSVSGARVYNTLTPKRALVDRIAELQNTIASYDALLQTAELQRQENEMLKKELGRSVAPHGILAHVITQPRRSFYDTFIIDGGAAQGISVGQTAYAFDGIAVGTISNVEKNNATVLLYSAPGRETSGTATGNNVAVTLIGRGGGEYEVHLPRDVHFDIGELIAYQSTASAVLAQIEKITTDPRDPFQRLLAKAPVNLQALKWVIVK